MHTIFFIIAIVLLFLAGMARARGAIPTAKWFFAASLFAFFGFFIGIP